MRGKEFLCLNTIMLEPIAAFPFQLRDVFSEDRSPGGGEQLGLAVGGAGLPAPHVDVTPPPTALSVLQVHGARRVQRLREQLHQRHVHHQEGLSHQACLPRVPQGGPEGGVGPSQWGAGDGGGRKVSQERGDIAAQPWLSHRHFGLDIAPLSFGAPLVLWGDRGSLLLPNRSMIKIEVSVSCLASQSFEGGRGSL